MPAESTQVELGAVKPAFHHGGVLETIMAKMNGSQGDRITAGVRLSALCCSPPFLGTLPLQGKSRLHVSCYKWYLLVYLPDVC